MGKTKIEWTDRVWNPTTGCTKVSQGCKHCYAERMAGRIWGERKFTDIVCHMDRLEIPLRWKQPQRIFVDSMSDLFHEQVPFGFVQLVFEMMFQADQHTYQILTKRPERMLEFITRYAPNDWISRGFPWPLPNVWLGVSAENQETADQRIPVLLRTPAAVRFVSAEPLLGPMFIQGFLLDGWHKYAPRLNWLIVGGESGPGARPMHPDWARGLRDQCQVTGTKFFFKQWGEWSPASANEVDENGVWKGRGEAKYVWGTEKCGYYCDEAVGHVDHREALMKRVGKKKAGRMLDGREWNEFPVN